MLRKLKLSTSFGNRYARVWERIIFLWIPRIFCVRYIPNNLEQFPKIFRCILDNILDFLLYGYKNEKVLLFLYRSEGYRYQRSTVELSKFQVSNFLILRLLIVYLC